MTAMTARPNTYAGACTQCSGQVAAGAGLLGGKVNGRWTVRHAACGSTPPPKRTVTKSTARRTSSHRCESCGRSGAHLASDSSGIVGYVCYRCDDGAASFG